MQPVVEQYSVKADYFGDSDEALQAALEFVATSPGLQNPHSIRSVIDQGLEGYIAVFVPGGIRR